LGNRDNWKKGGEVRRTSKGESNRTCLKNRWGPWYSHSKDKEKGGKALCGSTWFLWEKGEQSFLASEGTIGGKDVRDITQKEGRSRGRSRYEVVR